MAAVAPTVAINGIPDGKQRDTESLSLDVTGGTYDRLTYEWSSNYGGTDQFDDNTSETPTWTRPDVDSDRNVSVKCIVTAHDDSDNTQAVRTDTEPTTILHVPNADAPSINVLYPPEDFEGVEYTLATEVGKTHEGTYDNLTYNWFVFHGDTDTADDVLDDRTAANPVWTRNRVGGRTLFQINCNLRAHGTNGNALKDTEEWTQSFVQPWVDDRPDADAPSLDYVQTTNTDPSTSDDPGWVNGFVEGLEGTNFWARIRINETHHGLFDALSAEFTLVGRDDVDEEIQTWTWTRPDDTPSGGHPTESSAFMFTRPMVNSDQQYKITVFLTATGNDMEAERGTSEITDNDSGYGWVRNFPQAQAPTVLIQHLNLLTLQLQTGIPNATEGTQRDLIAAIDGGVYDEISYAWEIVDYGAAAGTGSHSNITPFTASNPVLRYPYIAVHHQYDMICTVTVRGTGTNAEDGSSDTATDRRFFWSNPLPAADAPSAVIEGFANGRENTAQQLTLNLGSTHTGLYDSLSFEWKDWTVGSPEPDDDGLASAFDDPTAQSPIWTRPYDGSGPVRWNLRCYVTAHGDDGNANDGTSETTATPILSTTVEPLGPVGTPTVTVDAVPDGAAGTSAHLHANFGITGGEYDTVNYDWRVNTGGREIRIGGDSENVIWHRPSLNDPNTAQSATIVCTVIVRGNGNNAEDGSEKSIVGEAQTNITPAADQTILNVIDGAGNVREISEVAISDASGRGRTLTELVVTSGNGTPTEVWRHGA